MNLAKLMGYSSNNWEALTSMNILVTAAVSALVMIGIATPSIFMAAFQGFSVILMGIAYIGEHLTHYKVDFRKATKVSDVLTDREPAAKSKVVSDPVMNTAGQSYERSAIGGLSNLTKTKRVAAVYGSRRTLESNGYYQSAMEFSRKLAEMGYVVRTGGGSGIMEAANRGAHSVDPKLSEGVSLRQITDREPPNAFITAPGGIRAEESFGARKAAIASGISAAVFYPGSTGTFDEFFDLLDVVKCGLHDTLGLDAECVVVCVGVAFWEPLRSFHEAVGLTFPEFVRIVDSTEDALRIVPRPI